MKHVEKQGAKTFFSNSLRKRSKGIEDREKQRERGEERLRERESQTERDRDSERDSENERDTERERERESDRERQLLKMRQSGLQDINMLQKERKRQGRGGANLLSFQRWMEIKVFQIAYIFLKMGLTW